MKTIFSNVNNIKSFSAKMLDELSERVSKGGDQLIGEVFIKFVSLCNYYVTPSTPFLKCTPSIATIMKLRSRA